MKIKLTNQKAHDVEISRVRNRAELVTDDAKVLRGRLEAETGERIAALEAFRDKPRDAGRANKAAQPMERRTLSIEKIRSTRGMEITI